MKKEFYSLLENGGTATGQVTFFDEKTAFLSEEDKAAIANGDSFEVVATFSDAAGTDLGETTLVNFRKEPDGTYSALIEEEDIEIVLTENDNGTTFTAQEVGSLDDAVKSGKTITGTVDGLLAEELEAAAAENSEDGSVSGSFFGKNQQQYGWQDINALKKTSETTFTGRLEDEPTVQITITLGKEITFEAKLAETEESAEEMVFTEEEAGGESALEELDED